MMTFLYCYRNGPYVTAYLKLIIYLMHTNNTDVCKGKGKAIPVTGREGP
jgi:hypothetical protein